MKPARSLLAGLPRAARLAARALAGIGVVAVMLTGIATVHTWSLPEPRPDDVVYKPLREIDAQRQARRLAEALTFRTESGGEASGLAKAEFQAFHRFLRAEFPRTHAALKVETINELSLLYTWPGIEPQKSALLLLAHQDVVPISPGTLQDWTHPPYAGEIADGYVWGRGAMDDKGSLIGLLAAVEALVDSGFRPQRTLYLAFGHDEEIGGTQGAQKLAAALQARGARIGMVVDEGGFVTENIFPVSPPVALIGVAEKGYASLRLRAEAPGGHSSTPPGHSAIGLIANALARLDAFDFPADLRHARTLNAKLASAMPWPDSMVLSNDWLFGPLIVALYSRERGTNAWIRTTVAPTIVRAGNKDNVIPEQAEAVVNFRLLPGITVDALMAQVREVIDDERVQVGAYDGHNVDPTPVSPTHTRAYRLLERTVYESLPEAGAIVGPYLVLGGTDARHYQALSPNIYRFALVRVGKEDIPRVHGTDERLALAALPEIIGFYQRLIRNFQSLHEDE